MALTSDDTIFALSSGVGRAAIAVIRLSGPQVRDVLVGMCGKVPAARQAVLRKIRRRDRGILDESLVLFFPGPHSETGEDICEFQVHGGRAVVAGVLAEIATYPHLRPAEPGEFARRALLNGKLSLLEVEALADLIDAETELQRAYAVGGGGSLLFQRSELWRETILEIRAELEAGHDFSDEGDVAERLDSQAERKLRELLLGLEDALARGVRGERVREGLRLAIMGQPNAGKSSLLNALAGRDVAIVSAIPGTTRDRIEIHLDLSGVPVVVWDTAGLQDSGDEVEREGMRRAMETGANADLVIWLSASNAPPSPPPAGLGSHVWVVHTKADLGRFPGGEFSISVKEGSGLDGLLARIETFGRDWLGGEPALLTRRRHTELIRSASGHLRLAVAARGQSEICAEELRLAALFLDRLVGRVDVEDVLGAIFSRFCVGK